MRTVIIDGSHVHDSLGLFVKVGGVRVSSEAEVVGVVHRVEGKVWISKETCAREDHGWGGDEGFIFFRGGWVKGTMVPSLETEIGVLESQGRKCS